MFVGGVGNLVDKLRVMESKIDGSGEDVVEVMSFLTQVQAAELDQLLIDALGFTVDQIMELAGLSVATAIAETYVSSEYSHVLVICGPGNNGCIGLVAARHLHHFGYQISIFYPKCTANPLHNGLVAQLESFSVPFLSVQDLPLGLSDSFDVLVDAIFGLSFLGSPRPPFDVLIQRLVALQSSSNQKQEKVPVIVSVDIPSGWHVEEGDLSGKGLKPDMLVSLSAPKLCARKFRGAHHFLGGRFISPSIEEKFQLRLPAYPGTSLCVRIGNSREKYVSPEQQHIEADPFDQFQKWLEDAVGARLKRATAVAVSTARKDGQLSSRMVLLRSVDRDGFIWNSNYESRKAEEISENPHAALLFCWSGLNREVRVEGTVQKISEEESHFFFYSRPRESQIAALVSKQSIVIPIRQALHEEYKELEAKYSDGSVIPKPENAGGYRLTPHMFEFLQGQQAHRLRYTLEDIDGKKIWTLDPPTRDWSCDC